MLFSVLTWCRTCLFWCLANPIPLKHWTGTLIFLTWRKHANFKMKNIHCSYSNVPGCVLLLHTNRCIKQTLCCSRDGLYVRDGLLMAAHWVDIWKHELLKMQHRELWNGILACTSINPLSFTMPQLSKDLLPSPQHNTKSLPTEEK